MSEAIRKAFAYLDPAHPDVREALSEISRLQVSDARYRFLRDDNDWHQSDRYWEAISAGGDKLDAVIDAGIKSRDECEEEEEF
jgi:hypothetical protein